MNRIDLPTTRWHLCSGDRSAQRELARELGISPIISQILTSRNIANISDAKKYLTPSLTDLHNPFLMQGMKEGVSRVVKAIYAGERIAIYGDYDADGVTSVVLLLKFLKDIDVAASYYIPNRMEDGYGLHNKIIEQIKDSGATLLLTVDCGISDYEQVTHAESLGLDVIILDHHEIPATVPKTVATINPHRHDCQFPFKDMAAVGIAFNFLIALRGALRQEGFWAKRHYPNLRNYLDLVALGTIGDVAPLVDENRIFAKVGLELIAQGSRVGVRALKEICGLEQLSPVTSRSVSFSLLPRINAAGRIASANDAVQLLMSDHLEEARSLARKLDEYNRRRQLLEKTIFQDIVKEVEGRGDLDQVSSLVFASADWHPGVIGIVASRLVERFCRPVILISLRDGIGKGSGRSVADFNIYKGLKKCDSLLLAYGGHQFAAGISIREDGVAEFAEMLDDVIRRETDITKFVSRTLIEAQCRLKDINYDLLAQIDTLAPFGSRNPEPVVCVRNVNVTCPAVVGKNNLRIKVHEDGISRDSIWFSKGQFRDSLAGTPLDIAFTPQINEWNGFSDIQLNMKDIAWPTID